MARECVFASIFGLLLSGSVVAQEASSRSVKLIIPYAPGGSYDLYARLVAEYLPKYLPQSPTFVIQNMPGAGGVVAVQTMYAKEPQDGTSLMVMPRDVAVSQVLRPEIGRYDSSRFGWIGAVSSYTGVLFVASRAGIKSADDLKQKQVIIGSWGQQTESFVTPTLLNSLAGTKFKIVTGYSGGPEVDLAVDRGEVESRVASWVFLKSQRANWLKDNSVTLPFQTGTKRHAELMDVPLMSELTSEQEAKQILEFMSSDAGVGWSIATTPNVPKEKIAELRAAFTKMTNDTGFKMEAERRGLEINSAPGEEVEALVRHTVATPQAALARLKSIIGTAN